MLSHGTVLYKNDKCHDKVKSKLKLFTFNLYYKGAL